MEAVRGSACTNRLIRVKSPIRARSLIRVRSGFLERLVKRFLERRIDGCTKGGGCGRPIGAWRVELIASQGADCVASLLMRRQTSVRLRFASWGDHGMPARGGHDPR